MNCFEIGPKRLRKRTDPELERGQDRSRRIGSESFLGRQSNRSYESIFSSFINVWYTEYSKIIGSIYSLGLLGYHSFIYWYNFLSGSSPYP